MGQVKVQYADGPPEGNQEARVAEMFSKGPGKSLIQQKFLVLPVEARIIVGGGGGLKWGWLKPGMEWMGSQTAPR